MECVNFLAIFYEKDTLKNADMDHTFKGTNCSTKYHSNSEARLITRGALNSSRKLNMQTLETGVLNVSGSCRCQ